MVRREPKWVVWVISWFKNGIRKSSDNKHVKLKFALIDPSSNNIQAITHCVCQLFASLLQEQNIYSVQISATNIFPSTYNLREVLSSLLLASNLTLSYTNSTMEYNDEFAVWKVDSNALFEFSPKAVAEDWK